MPQQINSIVLRTCKETGKSRHDVARCGLLRFLLAVLVSFNLQACEEEGPANDDTGDDDVGSEAGYPFAGTLSGLEGAGPVVIQIFDATVLRGTYSLTANGPFQTQAVLPAGETFRVFVDFQSADGSNQDCRFTDPGPSAELRSTWLSGTMAAGTVGGIAIECEPAYRIEGSVSGLEGSGLTLRYAFVDRDPAIEPISFPEVIAADGEFTATRRAVDGTTYSVSIEALPSDPDQSCTVTNGEGTVNGADVRDIEVVCDSTATIGGAVEGLRGTGLQLALTATKDDEATLTDSVTVDEDGPFEFDVEVPTEYAWEVTIAAQPTPEQECSVGKGVGVIGEGREPGESFDVTDVEVSCEGPYRIYSFDDDQTRNMAEALFESAGESGTISVDYQFPGLGPATTLGDSFETPNLEIFERYLDPEGSSGHVFSIEDGTTYWLAVESPAGDPLFTVTDNPVSHYVDLDTYWEFRKTAADATFRLTVTRVQLLARDAGTQPPVIGSLRAEASLSIRGTNEQRQVFFDATSRALLAGHATPDRSNTDWVLQKDIVPTGATQSIWTDQPFHLDIDRLSGTQSRALAELTTPVTVEVDLSSVTVGETFTILSDATVHARNSYSEEGVAGAFLRDPGGFDPGSDDGATLIETSGLDMLATSADVALELASGVPIEPQPCTSAEFAELQFDASELVVSEVAADQVPPGSLRITRTGASQGLVAAQISMTGDTATAGEDFEQQVVDVRFGDGSTTARTVELNLIDDDFVEADETFTLTLHSPLGCATVGSQDTATITIVSEDVDTGTLALSSGAYTVDEAAGFAEVEVVRSGGGSGTLVATLATADGTGQASIDYGAVTQRLIFNDGDAAAQLVQIPILDNTAVDGDRTVMLELSSDSSGTVGSPAVAMLTIIDNDGADGAGSIELSAADYAVSESAGAAEIEVLRKDGSSGDVSVTVRTRDGAADAGDYTPIDATVSFASGDRAAKTVSIPITDDSLDEGNEELFIDLSGATGGATLGPVSTAVLTIADDDGVLSPPGAPVLSVVGGAKQFTFLWQPVDGATSYQLLQDSGDGSGFVNLDDPIDANASSYTLDVAVHLFDWANTQFLLQACNPTQCTDSQAISADPLMLESIGFFKASNAEGEQQRAVSITDRGDLFGHAVAVSADGNTIAVSAYDEDSNATFINGDQSNNDLIDSGAVYIFSRGANGWVQQAYLKAPNVNPAQPVHGAPRFGASLSISADGNTVAVGADRSDQTGMSDSGAAYVYSRSQDVWTFEAELLASNAAAQDYFGAAIALSADGQTLVVAATGEDGDSDSINGDETNDDASDAGAVYVFTRDGGIWGQRHYLKASNSDNYDQFGAALAINADGSALAVGAPGEGSLATGVNGDQADNSAPGDTSGFSGAGAVYLFEQNAGVWLQTDYIKASNTDARDQFGNALALSRDGTVLAVAAQREDSNAVGVNAPGESDNSATEAGAVYVYRSQSGLWAQSAYLKASNTKASNFFGSSVSLSDDGQYLVVGAAGESSLATGINGDQSQTLFTGPGAAYLFSDDGGTYEQVSYIKAPNSDLGEFAGAPRSLAFASQLAISGDAKTLVIGARGDSSDATGIGGDWANLDATGSGAVFVY